jgi:uncharacterized membrane protein YbhN (UPF0104 family)
MSLRALRVPLQLAVTAVLLVILWRLSGGQALVSRLTSADPAWVVAGLLCATLAMGFAALRWRYTAQRIGAGMSVERALREFYLAAFLNQILPGGVSGDAVRAWRHGKRAAEHERAGVGPAVRAVIIERVANQLVMSLCMLGSLSLWPWMPGAFAAVGIWVPLVGVVVVLAGVLVAIALFARRGTGGRIERFVRDTRLALLGRRTLLAQLGLGLLVTASCVAAFYCAARAVDATLSLFHLLALVPAALLSMTIPISIGGWGVREASTVALWSIAGLAPAEALASSILYGVLALLVSLPGAVVLMTDRS